MSRHKEETGNWCVYIHTVPKEISGYNHDKYYIGITKQKPSYRWNNGEGYKTQLFYKAICKYGWDNIRHDVVAIQLNEDLAKDMERLLIFMYRSFDKKYGYNTTFGGEGANGYTYSDEEKEKKSVLMKQLWKDENYRKKVTEHIHRGADNHNSLSVVLLNTGEVFDCERDAAKTYGISVMSLNKYLIGNVKCPIKDENGNCLVWMFYDDYKNMSNEEIEKKIKHETRYQGHAKAHDPFVCLNTGEVFYYSFEMTEKYGVDIANATANSLLQKKSAGVLKDGTRLAWARLSQLSSMAKEEIDERINMANSKPKPSSKSKRVVDILTLKVYTSFTKCAKDTNVAKSTMYKIVQKTINETNKHKGRFIYLDEYIKTSGEDEEAILKTLEFVD